MKNCPSCNSDNISNGAPSSSGACFVLCFDCKTSGPYGSTQIEAEVMWDLLPRRDDPPAFHGSVYTIGERTYHVDFHHNGPITLCAITWVDKKGRMAGLQGASFCNPKDAFDPNIGERLAMKRACGLGDRYFFNIRDLYDAWRRDQWEAMKSSEIKEPAP